MTISQETVEDLCKKCGLRAEECRTFLAQHNGDVEATLAALVESGRIQTDDLNPELVSDAIFERAAFRDKVELYRRILAKGEAQAKMWGLGPDMTPEQKAASDFADRAEKISKLQAGGKRFITAADQARSSVRSKRRSAWLDSNPKMLSLPPFPPLKMTLNEWQGKDALATWAGTQPRHGGYTSVSSDQPSDGSFELRIPRLDRDDRNPKPPAPEQIAAYAYLKENERAITDSVFTAILVLYAKLRPRWLEEMPDSEDLPELNSIDQLQKHIGLGILHMFGLAKQDQAYFGLEIGCTWDEEHGVGVILHRGRIVEIGQADASFDSHPVYIDGGVEISATG